MNAATKQPAFATTSETTGRTLYRFVFRLGRDTIRTCEQWHQNDEDAYGAAVLTAHEWANCKRSKVLHCYPVPAVASATGTTIVGGP